MRSGNLFLSTIEKGRSEQCLRAAWFFARQFSGALHKPIHGESRRRRLALIPASADLRACHARAYQRVEKVGQAPRERGFRRDLRDSARSQSHFFNGLLRACREDRFSEPRSLSRRILATECSDSVHANCSWRTGLERAEQPVQTIDSGGSCGSSRRLWARFLTRLTLNSARQSATISSSSSAANFPSSPRDRI